MVPWLLLPRILLVLDTRRPRDKDGSEGVAALWSGFCARSLLSCRKLHWSPFEHWPFFFPLVASTFSSFKTTHSLTIFDHCSCFKSPVPGVKVSQSKFLICTPLHHCLQFFIFGHRYLLMNLHVVHFQCSFELRGLTYSQFVPDGIFDIDTRTSSHIVSNS